MGRNKLNMAMLSSSSVFAEVLLNTTGRHLFTRYCESKKRDEHIKCWNACERFRALVEVDKAQAKQQAHHIYNVYLSPDAAFQLKFPMDVVLQVNASLEQCPNDLFQQVQSTVFRDMFRGPYMQMLKEYWFEAAIDEMEARVYSRFEANLGDNVLLTVRDENGIDKISSVSEGILNTTGYSVVDFIDSSPEFLLGVGSERHAYTSILDRASRKQYGSELLLTYRRDGTPVWALMVGIQLDARAKGPGTRMLWIALDVTRNVNAHTKLASLVFVRKEGSDPDLAGPKAGFFSSLRRRSRDLFHSVTKSHATLDGPSSASVIIPPYRTVSTDSAPDTFGRRFTQPLVDDEDVSRQPQKRGLSLTVQYAAGLGGSYGDLLNRRSSRQSFLFDEDMVVPGLGVSAPGTPEEHDDGEHEEPKGDVPEVEGPVGAEWRVVRTSTPIETLMDSVVDMYTNFVVLSPPSNGLFIKNASPSFCSASGYEESELKGQTLAFLNGARSDKRVWSNFNQILQAGLAVSSKLSQYTKSGSLRYNAVHATPVRDENRTVTGYVLFFQWNNPKSTVTQRKTKRKDLSADSVEDFSTCITS
eukprot:Colp12_sorted_trinity150504_noHs@22129